MNEIYPDDLKRLYRYGVFLKQIINNKFEALLYFRKIYQVYHVRLSKQQQNQGNMGNVESAIFGENTACGVVIISANAFELGTI